MDEVSHHPRNKDTVPKKLKLVVPWNSVCAALEQQAGLHGLSNAMIQTIWWITKHSASPTNIKFKRQLILCMMPDKEVVDTGIIEEIIYSISHSNEKPGADQLKLTLLQYLIGLFEYNLLDVDIFNNHFFYGLIFQATRLDSLIPWACHFIKKITKRELLKRNYILDLFDMMGIPLPGIALKCVGDLLRQCKLLRPDLLPNNVFKFSAVGQSKKLDLKPAFRKRLFEAKSRLLGIPNSLLHIPKEDEAMDIEDDEAVTGRGGLLKVLNSKCFPEFKLYQEGDTDDIKMWKDYHKYDIMRCAIKKRETLPILVKDPAALEYFNTYLSLVFQHKFDSYDVKIKQCYDFILQRCVEVTILQGQGLPAVNEWLCNFFLTWDGVLFKRQIMDLLPYLSPTDFADGYTDILYKLEGMFLDGAAFDRIEIWKILEGWFYNWSIEFLQNEGDNEDRTAKINNRDSLEFLFNFINELVCKYACTDGDQDEIFLEACCQAYTKFNAVFDGVKTAPFYIIPPRALWHMVILSDSLLALEAFTHFAASIDPQKLKHLRKTPKEAPFLIWKKQIWPEFQLYFGYSEQEGGTKLLFQDLFANELQMITHSLAQSKGSNNPKESELVSTCKQYGSSLVKSTAALFATNSRCLSVIKKDPTNSQLRLALNLDDEKAQQLTPSLFTMLNFLENRLYGTEDNVSHIDD